MIRTFVMTKRCFTETQGITPPPNSGKQKTLPFNRNKPRAGPGSYGGGTLLLMAEKEGKGAGQDINHANTFKNKKPKKCTVGVKFTGARYIMLGVILRQSGTDVHALFEHVIVLILLTVMKQNSDHKTSYKYIVFRFFLRCLLNH